MLFVVNKQNSKARLVDWKLCRKLINDENRILGTTLPSSGHYGK